MTELDLARFETLSFDCYGTLTDWEAAVGGTAADHFRRMGSAPSSSCVRGHSRSLWNGKTEVQRVVDRLIRKGYLKCDRTPSGNVRTGTIEPTPEAYQWRSLVDEVNVPEGKLVEVSALGALPISCGAVGGPDDLLSDAIDRGAECMKVPVEYVRPGVFLMKVTGESMGGDHLHTGDHVMIDEAASWHDSDMVAVRQRGVTRK
jgi:SOS-response transcriptional repressor LexA